MVKMLLSTERASTIGMDYYEELGTSIKLTFFRDLSKFVSGPGMMLLTEKEARSSIIAFYMQEKKAHKSDAYNLNLSHIL